MLGTVDGFRGWEQEAFPPSLITYPRPPPMGRRQGYWPSIAFCRWTAFWQFWPPTWALSQGPLVGPWGCFPTFQTQELSYMSLLLLT
ncbi:hypothetical protein [Acinetobacter baumannii]|uniref:hypothetical protein n=1 Tax=Acinetobacter baumannii TaxID=470 RepID=UPI003397D4EC